MSERKLIRDSDSELPPPSEPTAVEVPVPHFDAGRRISGTRVRPRVEEILDTLGNIPKTPEPEADIDSFSDDEAPTRPSGHSTVKLPPVDENPHSTENIYEGAMQENSPLMQSPRVPQGTEYAYTSPEPIDETPAIVIDAREDDKPLTPSLLRGLMRFLRGK